MASTKEISMSQDTTIFTVNFTDGRSVPYSREDLYQYLKSFEEQFIKRNIENIDLIDYEMILDNIVAGVTEKISYIDLINLIAETLVNNRTTHPNYATLAGFIVIAAHQEKTSDSFSQTMNLIYKKTKITENMHSGFSYKKKQDTIDGLNAKKRYLLALLEVMDFKDPSQLIKFQAAANDFMRNYEKGMKKQTSLLNETFYANVKKFGDRLDQVIDYENDFNYDYFGFKTLEKAYLVKIDDKPVERPQHMLMRVALAIHKNDIDRVIETYKLMSKKLFTHASPTCFNAGMFKQQLSSCFLLGIDDSIDGIYECLRKCADISKEGGGIGVHIHNIRADGSVIRGTNGKSDGIIPMLRVFNATCRYVNQSGKRNGAIAIYIEPWHKDIMEFLDLKKNTGEEELRARDLFYAMWIPDLFMRRVEDDGDWTLFCPNKCKNLYSTYGEEFEKLYYMYESNVEEYDGKTVKARDIFTKIIHAQIETGSPYMLYKDHVNRKSNQKNIGTIMSSNLCTEIMEVSDANNTSVCNLASIGLPEMVKTDENGETYFDFELLGQITRVITRNLNRVIDVNRYPIYEAKTTNLRDRPIGIGVQGLADIFLKMRMPFASSEAKKLNKKIFETMYYYALVESVELAKEEGPYDTFDGSPASKGILQFDMWNVRPSKVYDWIQLKKDIMNHGLRNSLLIAPMPTAGTSQILGNCECFEPYMTNVFTRRTMAGEFIIVNRFLVQDLIKLNLWNREMQNKLIAYEGSVQDIDEIPDDIKQLYLTAFEIKQKDIIDMAADRGAFIDQSQSMNLFVAVPEFNKIASMHIYAWKQGLKTGQYYLRTKSAVSAVKIGVDTDVIAQKRQKEESSVPLICRRDDPDCIACSG